MMTRLAVRAVLVSILAFGLAACEDGFEFGQSSTTTDEAAPAARTVSSTGVQDVERPDIFQTTEAALWDGRPSLGGIWVAHPDVTTPERAIITNDTTGQRIAGALFRRERESPGPKVQLSSDAAVALNILAGAPTQVTIVAVRQEEIVVEEPDPVISDEDVGDEDAGGEDGAEPGDAELAAAAAATPGADGEETGAEPKPRGNFFQRLFGRRSPAPETAAAAAALADGADDTAESAAVPEVETQTLDPVAAGAAAAIARAEAEDKPAPRPEREASPSGLRSPFVQVGLFSEEANAFSARDNLRTAGIVPSVLEGSNSNGPFWRVVVGPITSADDQREILAQVKGLGFQDAFLTDQ